MNRVCARLLCCLPLAAPAATWYVAPSGADGSPATNWATAAATIQSALDRSAFGDEVLVSNGIYATGARWVEGSGISNRVVVPAGVHLRSVAGPDATIIEGVGGDQFTNPGAVRCVFLGSNAILSGFTVRHGGTLTGLVDRMGGAGVWCASPASVISNCIVVSNWAKGVGERGGGVRGGTVLDSVLRGNRCGYENRTYFAGLQGGEGGGGADLTIWRSVVADNAAGTGGGVCGANVWYSDLTNNHAGFNDGWWYGEGGGAFNSTLTFSRVRGNTAATGGGLHGGEATDSRLDRNRSRVGGGAYGSTLAACVVWSNESVQPGLTHGYVGDGGGVANCCASECLFQENVAAWTGGGAKDSELHRCTILLNRVGWGTSVGWGGGASGGTLVGCLIVSNAVVTPDGAGGGVERARLYNCVLIGNRGSYSSQAKDSELRNCTLTETAASFAAIQGGVVENCIIYPLREPLYFTPVHCVTNDPRFAATTQEDYRLRHDSPCINAGTNQPWMAGATDFAGGPRIQHGRVDIGAFEYAGSLTDTDDDGLPDDLETGTGHYAAWDDAGTRIDAVDSDGDGWTDGREVWHGSDPTRADMRPRQGAAAPDYDGDGRRDLAVYHPPTGRWYIRQSSDGSMWGGGPVQWGWIEARPVVGDFDGDERSDVAVYHPERGFWYPRTAGGQLLGGVPHQWGWREAEPVCRDYDGDGKGDFAVHHKDSGLWFVENSLRGGMLAGGAFRLHAIAGWVPVPGDYDGDGCADPAAHLAPRGFWCGRLSATGRVVPEETGPWNAFGWHESEPVPADYDGDGEVDVAVYHARGGNWYIRKSSDFQLLEGGPINWGWSETIPVPGDYDADGRADLAVYHPATGMWFIRQAREGEAVEVISVQWGWSEAVVVR